MNMKISQGYFEMADYLNNTGRPILYSCCFVNADGLRGNYEAAEKSCNQWRVDHDIDDSWNSLTDIMNFVADNQDTLVQYAGPGHWNDPDMLLIGGYGLSIEQSKSQMTVWAIIAAPLLMSNDLATIDEGAKDILLNTEAIKINQDPLGIQGIRRSSDDNVHVWTRELATEGSSDLSMAVGLVSYRTDGYIIRKTFKLSDFGLDNENGYEILDVFDPTSDINSMVFAPSDDITVGVKPTGAVLLRATPVAN